MIIDEAIKHCEEEVERIERNHPYIDVTEYRQIAEWLKELKAYREAEEEIDRKRKSGQWSEAVVFGMSRALLIMRRHIKGVNADEDSD